MVQASFQRGRGKIFKEGSKFEIDGTGTNESAEIIELLKVSIF